jgi:hypothetical protein
MGELLMIYFPKTLRPSRKIVRANRRQRLKAARKEARTSKKNLNQLISELHAEFQQEDDENNACNSIQWIFKRVLNPQLINLIAEKNGFKTRKRKIEPISFLAVLMVGCLNPNVDSLTIMCALFKKWFNIIMKPQSLQAFINRPKTYEFIKEIQNIVIQFEMKRTLDKLKNKKKRLCTKFFNKILLQDSTIISLPETLSRIFKGSGGSGSKAAIKIDIIFDINQSSIINMKCCAGRVSDGNANISEEILKHVGQEDLVIRDLGYFNIKQLSKIANKNAYFISRLSKSINIYLNENDEKPFDIIEYVEKNNVKHKEIDMWVYLGKTERVPVRLIVIKVPPEVVEIRRAKHKRANGRSKEPSESLIEWNGYTFMITNIPKEQLSYHAILILYKTRWQIELLFKNFKTNLSIDEITGENKYRILCLLHIKILLAWLVTLLCAYAQTLTDKEVSFFQTTRWLQRVGDFPKILLTGEIAQLLNELSGAVDQLCKQQKRSKKSSLENVQRQLEEENIGKIDKKNFKKVA